MQVSIKWLNDYIKFNETAEELADKYTICRKKSINPLLER